MHKGDDDIDGGNDVSSSSLLGSFDDSLNSNIYLRDGRRSSVFRCREGNHVSSTRRKMVSLRREGKKANSYLDKSKLTCVKIRPPRSSLN